MFSFRATGRRSNESIELQPLHLKGPKGVLRRMPRVRSDEIHETNTDQIPQHPPEKEKTPSPIGAGLPLLQRLRLLKEKQVSWIYNLFMLKHSLFIYSPSNWIDYLCFCSSKKYFHAKFTFINFDSRRSIVFTKKWRKKCCTNLFLSFKFAMENYESTFFIKFKTALFRFFLLFKYNASVLLQLHSSFNLYMMMAHLSEESKCFTISNNWLCCNI